MGKQVKRAISLAGGGPAVGLSLGAMKRLCVEEGIEFDLYSTACIGAWVATTFNMNPEKPVAERYQTSENFFRQVFRPDEMYDRFPVATIFAPNFRKMAMNSFDYLMQPQTYRNLVLPQHIWEALHEVWRYMQDPSQWNDANLNSLILNSMIAPNPFARFMTSLMYQTNNVEGLAQIYYPESAFLGQINFDSLYQPGQPVIYHNAWNLDKQRLEQFTNRPLDGHGDISAESLCGCSALPYVTEPVQIGDDKYCEGATIDAVNFEGVLADHHEIEEVWISRILDSRQIRSPKNLGNALNNLIMLFAANASEDDVKLFKYSLWERRSSVRVVEIPVATMVDYDWSYSNLDRGIQLGYEAAEAALDDYRRNGPTRFDELPALALAAE